ncbi:MAG TPA: transcriptional regulator [Opitutales bacterium]|jgi:DNA-binding transcriptional regulator GbsR (MarR family)|nr:transcriptional regulator [Opitutales bacterium]
MSTTEQTTAELRAARERFISQWGVISAAWGINRTMAQIHALLLTSPAPVATDEIMEALQISRGNVNTNLRELVGWGLIRIVLRKGERKEFFEAEKDVWRIFCTIARERQRREIDPALAVLRECAERTAKLKGTEAEEFHATMSKLGDFVGQASGAMDRVARSERSKIMPLIFKMLR